MQQAYVLLDFPPDILSRLQSGACERVGGIVRETGSKQIVAWLRDSSTSPDPQLVQIPPGDPHGGLDALISLSVLNVGATLNFGVETQRRLGILNSKVDGLQRSVDQGFARLTAGLTQLRSLYEFDLAADLQLAGEWARDAQMLKLHSEKRERILQHALELARGAKTKLLTLARAESTHALKMFSLDWERAQTGRSYGPRPEPIAAAFMQRLRQVAFSVDLSCSIAAEHLGPAVAMRELEQALSELDSLRTNLGRAALFEHPMIYLCRRTVSPIRLDAWLRKYRGVDLAHALSTSLSAGDIDRIRAELVGYVSPDVHESWQFQQFAAGLESIDVDVDRLCGRAAEYEYAMTRNLEWHDYQGQLSFDVPDGAGPIVVLVLDEQFKKN